MEPRPNHHFRTRVPNACDTCKLRKIKCSGTKPCVYCARKQLPHQCHYTPPQSRKPRRRQISTSGSTNNNPPPSSSSPMPPIPPSTSTNNDTDHPHPEETEVPREARLLCDPQGKLIFIGDCAPLSFFQTVRRLVVSRVDGNAFASHSALENAYPYSRPRPVMRSVSVSGEPPAIEPGSVRDVVDAYLDATAGLIDLFMFDGDGLRGEVLGWVEGGRYRDATATSAVNYLVLAIGSQALLDDAASQVYFEYARDLAFADLSGNFGIGSLQGVQVHVLIALCMLKACQINGAFLFFGIAARAAYSIGIHRGAVNARFGREVHRQRDRLWKSIRVVDLFLSTSMGRPPAASDVDCTVDYRGDGEGREGVDLLSASVQILLVMERVVLEVYSRRKISPQLTEGISRELRDWSGRWLGRLKGVVEGRGEDGEVRGSVNGACQVLSSYYYAVILVSRPFLMVELHHRLLEEEDYGSGVGYGSGGGLVSGRSKLADACIDAAVLMVSPVQDLIARGEMAKRAPVVVSWLFAAALVLGLGLLGGFGRVIEKHCRASIAALEYFAESDAHAVQYSLIAKSLLATALEYLEKRETRERLKRTESSSQLFGLIPREYGGTHEEGSISTVEDGNHFESGKGHGKPIHHEALSPRTNFDFGSSFFGLAETLPRTPEFSSMMGVSFDGDDQSFGTLNLFPLLESDGIDLANLF